MRLIRLFWLPKQPVPPAGTPERAQHEALQIAVFGWPENRSLVTWGVRFAIFALWIEIIVGSYFSPNPDGLEMWLVRLGTTAVFIALAWRWLGQPR
jgi:hypothetical protein